nr:TetR/AcrR family transcriptional regulator [Antrihabitans stalactiti]
MIQAAARLLDEEGPSALSTRRLATEVGMSTMAVYTHFGGMPDLIRAVVQEAFDRFGAHLNAVERSDDPIADLARLAVAYRTNARTNPHLYAVMFAGGHAENTGEVAGALATFQILVDTVTRAIEAGLLRPGDPLIVAGQLWSALHGFTLLELAGFWGPDGLAPADDVAATMLTTMYIGLGGDPTTTAGSVRGALG